MISVIPFRARHLREIAPGADDRMMKMAIFAQESGPAYTGFLMGRAIGAGGVSIQRPGIGEAWTIFHPAIKAFPLFLHREVKTRLNRVIESLDEVYALCDDDGRWLKRLGFFHVKPSEKPELYALLEESTRIYVRRKWSC